jgi:uncharacterized protein
MIAASRDICGAKPRLQLIFMTPTIPLRMQGVLIAASLAAPASLWAAGATNPIIDSRSLLIFIAVFFGSVVVGAAGFGSAAVAGGIMLFWFIPISAVPILNSASLTTQFISLGHLWRNLQWRGCLPLIIGGLIGIPLGVFVLQWADPDEFRFGFGMFLMCWSCYLLMRPHLRLKRSGAMADAAVGLIGGISGGAIAFPGALPAIWCALTRSSKEEQRGTIQIFILVTQFCTLTYLFARGLVDRDFFSDYLKMLPAIMIGTFVGVYLFTKINEATFRRLVLLLLLVAGAAHTIHAVVDYLGNGSSPQTAEAHSTASTGIQQRAGLVRTNGTSIFSLVNSIIVYPRAGQSDIETDKSLNSLHAIAATNAVGGAGTVRRQLVDPPA